MPKATQRKRADTLIRRRGRSESLRTICGHCRMHFRSVTISGMIALRKSWKIRTVSRHMLRCKQWVISVGKKIIRRMDDCLNQQRDENFSA